QAKIFTGMASVFALAGGLVILDRNSDGMLFRFDPSIRQAVRLADHTDAIKCKRVSLGGNLRGCFYSASGSSDPKSPEFVVWGDSLATMPRTLFRKLADSGHDVMLFSTPSCGPLLGVWKERDLEKNCKKKNDEVAAFIQASHAD